MERALRKVKPWLDASEKLKHRHAALLLFLELTNEHEQAVFFEEHRALLYEYCLLCHRTFSSKLADDGNYKETVEKAVMAAATSQAGLKDFLDNHLRVSLAIQLVIKYAAVELVSGGPDERFMPDLVNLVSALLHVSNHAVVRREGMRAVLLWLRDNRLPVGIFRDLFGQAVRLQAFEESGNLPAGFNQTPADAVAGPSRVTVPLLAAPSGLTPLLAAKQAMRDLLHLITFDTDPNTSKTAITNIYAHFKDSYVAPYYQSDTVKCPEALQTVYVEYYALWTVQHLPDGFKTTAIPALCFMLSEHLLSNADELHFVNAVLRAAHLLPFQCIASIRTAMAVLRQWVFAGRERKPDFMVRATADQEEQYYSQYVAMTASIFNPDRPFIGLQQEQIALYREAMLFLRQFLLQPQCTGSAKLKEQVVEALLRIGEALFASPNKYSRIVTPGVAEDFAGFYGESLFVAVIRAAGSQAAQWEQIAALCRSLTRWPQFANAFGDQLLRLTEALIDVVVMCRVGGGGADINRPATPRQLQSASGRLSTDSLPEGSGRASPRPADFAMWSIVDSDRIVLLWRNLLTVFGDLHPLTCTDVHNSLVRTFIGVTDRLMAVREQQSATDPTLPLFELFQQLLQATRSVEDHTGRRAALLCLAQLVGSTRLAVWVGEERSLRVIDAVIAACGRVEDQPVALEAACLLINGHVFGFELLLDAVLPILSNPQCQPFLLAVNVLGNVAVMSGYAQAAFTILRSLFGTYRHDMAVLDVLVPVISTATVHHLHVDPSGPIATEGVSLLLEALTPYDLKIPTASISGADALIVWLLDCLGDSEDRSHILSLAVQRVTAAVRAVCLSTTAGNPKAAVQDRIGGALLSLLGRFTSCLPDGWLSGNPLPRQHLVECLQECLQNPLQLPNSLVVEAAERLAAFLRLRLVPGCLAVLAPESLDVPVECADVGSPEKGVHFVWSDALYSVMPHKRDHGKAVLVIRSVAGRCVWEVSRGAVAEVSRGAAASVEFPCPVKDKVELYSDYAGPWPADDAVVAGHSSSGELVMPTFAPATDMLGKLIEQLHADTLTAQTDQSDSSDNAVASLCRRRFTEELSVAEQYDCPRDTAHKHRPQPIENKCLGKFVPDYLLARQWLAALGLLSRGAYMGRQIEPLVPTSALFADTAALDALPSRLSVKAALIYQPAGRELESQVFSPISADQMTGNYAAFCQSLGWTVDLASHHAIHGYTAGLDAADTTDALMLYYGSEQVEIAWIESCRLRGVGVEEKRRLLGNSLVHVVWSEHVQREWRAGSVRGAVEIAVCAIPGRHLARVRVTAPPGVDFGPLRPGVSVQPLSVLGCLIRATVCSAHFASLAHLSRQPHLHPFTERANQISTMQRRHGIGMATFSKYLGAMAILPPPHNTIALQAAAAPLNYTAHSNAGEGVSPVLASRAALADFVEHAQEGNSDYEDAVSELMTKVTVSYV